MQTMLLWLVTVGALAVFARRFWLRLAPLSRARAANRTDQPMERLTGALADIGLHRRLLRFTWSGVLHFMIFTSFLVLSTAILQAFGSGLFPGFSLAVIGGDTWIALLQDIFALLMLIGLAMAAWQRFVRKPARFVGSKTGDATLIYLLAGGIVLTMLLEFATAIVMSGAPHAWRPVSTVLSHLLIGTGMTAQSASTAHLVFFWLHILIILTFLIYIPGSKHRHMMLAAFNLYFRPLTPKGQLPPPPTKLAEADTGTVETYQDFTWKDLLDTLSCTECGRCQSVCPAYAAGAPLSPKSLIMDLRDGLLTHEGVIDGDAHLPIIGGAISQETLWSCTTCRACMEVCPVHIEHVPKIVQLRRTMVEDGALEPMLQTAMTNFQSQGNSFGKPAKQRARWTKDLSFKPKDARNEPVDILWFVGDFASFDTRAQELTRMVAELLHKAGVDFGILYDGERNSGNDVRRVGDEGLFELLAQQNIDTLAGCTFNRIMTTDPHSLNALKSEYPALGANYDVMHYAQLLLDLIKAGKLTPRTDAGLTVTYHDPCYLGRYNGGFDAPRDLMAALGHTLKEMPRNRENSFCCGAGGGRIWMDDVVFKERPSENRIKEALELGEITHFVVSCPKDVVMYTAAIQNLGVGDRLAVRDLAELVTLSVA